MLELRTAAGLIDVFESQHEPATLICGGISGEQRRIGMSQM
jgi:hypothetical protein